MKLDLAIALFPYAQTNDTLMLISVDRIFDCKAMLNDS